MKTTVEIKSFKKRTIAVPIRGISPLVVHAFSEKARTIIIDKQGGKAKNAKHEIRNPEEEYTASKHISSQGWEGFPASGFKAAIIRGAKMIGLVMKDTQGGLFVKEDDPVTQLVKIEGVSKMRTDMVRVGMGSADVRYRAEYTDWSAVLNIEFNEGVISVDQIYQIVMAGGYGCGIGEMRPEKGKFNYGRWELDV